MTTKLSNPIIGFKRCAICKIDLKGKFVYIDDQIESLIGCSKEELFGKSLSDFLDEPSQNLINKILSHRNHYETFYDTATFTLLNKEKTPIRTKIVMSLNFIAGNPVNYLMIIDPLEMSSPRDESYAASELYISFLLDLIELESFFNFKKLLTILLKFVKANQVCFYMIKNDTLELRSIISDESSAEFVYKQAPDTADLHLQLAQSGEEYSFIDKQTVQKVIEKNGHAPNEYITRIDYFDENNYLLRFIFSDDFEYHLAEESINNAKLALSLIKKILEFNTITDISNETPFDIKFTIGFLDSLSIPAFITDNEGSIVGYNPAMLNYFNEKMLVGSYLKVIKEITKYNSHNLEKEIVDYVNSSYEKEAAVDLKKIIKLSPTDSASLTVMKTSDTDKDLSACFVFIPNSILSENDIHAFNINKIIK